MFDYQMQKLVELSVIKNETCGVRGRKGGNDSWK